MPVMIAAIHGLYEPDVPSRIGEPWRRLYRLLHETVP
jgi:hypothetical protein